MRGLLGMAVALMVVMPGVALAQSPDRPVVELGAQGSKRINGVLLRDSTAPGDSAPVAWSLRLTVNVKRRTAIEGTADIQKSYRDSFGSGARTSARELSVHWRQTVFTSGRLQVFGVLGAGRNRVERHVPEWIQSGQVRPPISLVVSEFVAHLGPAVQVELAPWLALRGDVRATLGQRDSGVRGMLGAVIPIGRIRDGERATPSTPPPAPAPMPASAPIPADWRRVKPGREVWATTNTGSLVHGKIAAISDSSVSIREQDREVTIRLDDVRLVEGHDSLRNGFLIGTVSGVVAGGLMGSALCDGGGPCGLAALLTAAIGAPVGGLFGLMVDGLIPGRQTLFGGNTIRVSPVRTPTTKAIGVAINLR